MEKWEGSVSRKPRIQEYGTYGLMSRDTIFRIALGIGKFAFGGVSLVKYIFAGFLLIYRVFSFEL
jgi:hypothetical protein